jgi:hypothetical protein
MSRSPVSTSSVRSSPTEQVLADVALAEVALDAVDSRRDLHAAGIVGAMHRTAARRCASLLIVDADVHVHESPGALAPYCDRRGTSRCARSPTCPSATSTSRASRRAATAR